MMKHNPFRVELVFTLPQVGAVIESPPQPRAIYTKRLRRRGNNQKTHALALDPKTHTIA